MYAIRSYYGFRTQLDYLDFMRVRAEVKSIERCGDGTFCVTVAEGQMYETQTVIFATGAYGQTLDVPGEKEFEMRGLCYSASYNFV